MCTLWLPVCIEESIRELMQVKNQVKNLCSYCEKRFITNTHKTNHERIHTGEKQCECFEQQFPDQKLDIQIELKIEALNNRQSELENLVYKQIKNLKQRISQLESLLSKEDLEKLETHAAAEEIEIKVSPKHEDFYDYEPPDFDFIGEKVDYEIADFSEEEKKIRGKSAKCEICSKEFANVKSKNRHLRIHAYSDKRPFVCDYCGNSFKTEHALKSHERTHTGDKPSETKTAKDSGEMREDSCDKPSRFRCDKCNLTFESKYLKRRHVIEAHKDNAAKVCEFCGQNFKSSDSYTIHIRTHTGEKPYKCDFCEEFFIGKYHLDKHHIVAHPDIECKDRQRHDCSFCKVAFPRKSLLKAHIRIHTGEKPFSCEHCGYQCASKKALQVHTRTHTGEKPFKCSYCEKRFITNTHKTNHERIHTGEKPYECPVCNHAFNQSSAMKNHLKLHSEERPYLCSECPKAF